MSIAHLLNVRDDQRDLDWLKTALGQAIRLEATTIAPYLTAMWSIKTTSHPVRRRIKEIAMDEMLHMGLACNLLSAIGGVPAVAEPAFVPTFPGGFPDGVHPGLVVGLQPLSKDLLRTFMTIEEPEFPPLAGDASVTVGAFYRAIQDAFAALAPPIDPQRQVDGPIGSRDLYRIRSLEDAQKALTLIREQGEGTTASPQGSADGTPAHYYRFAEIYHGASLVMQDGRWQYAGAPIPFPTDAEISPMAPVPPGGYPEPVPELDAFNRKYKETLVALQQLWATGGGPNELLLASVQPMYELSSLARNLMKKNIPGSSQTYGPTFALVP